MNGIEFLTEAMKRYPTAKRALLSAYADTEAAIAAINRVAADYDLLKPCHAIIVAVGLSYRKLEAPGIDARTGANSYVLLP
jgi:DNA-binding NarL/FixJ family response regulator